jgi:hypothetical protein
MSKRHLDDLAAGLRDQGWSIENSRLPRSLFELSGSWLGWDLLQTASGVSAEIEFNIYRHPGHISTLDDIDGCSFVAKERSEQTSLSFCDGNSPEWQQRLRLFLDCCKNVALKIESHH